CVSRTGPHSPYFTSEVPTRLHSSSARVCLRQLDRAAEDQKLYGSSATTGFFARPEMKERTRSSSFAAALPAKAAITTAASEVRTAKRGPPWPSTNAAAVKGR